MLSPPVLTSWLVFFFMSASSVAADFQFYSGGMSFRCTYNSSTHQTEVFLDLISGWALGHGPCGPNCTVSDIGRRTVTSTIADRASYTRNFGNWSIEFSDSSSITKEVDITDNVFSNMTHTVQTINADEGWELNRIQSHITLHNHSSVRRKDQDIMYDGNGWHYLSKDNVNRSRPWHLQSKINPNLRNDTGRPNHSPLVFNRPVYRVALNTKTSIPIAAVDPDGDLISCRQSEYVENGDVDERYILNGTMIQHDCMYTIYAKDSYGYHDNFWMPALFSASDYNVYTIEVGTVTNAPYRFMLTSTHVKFLVHVVASVGGPEFVPPTSAPNTRVLIWQGATWTTAIYAKALNGLRVSQFHAIGRQGEHVTLSNISDTSTSQFVRLSWTPTIQDVGYHIVCVSATDSGGTMSGDDRCFIIEVKDNKQEQTNSSQVIYFPANMPSVELITNIKHVLPVYVKGNGLLTNLTVTSTDVSNWSLGVVSRASSATPPIYLASLQFEHVTDGNIHFCFSAVMSSSPPASRCFNFTIIPPDPCSSNPCKNSGTCIRSTVDVYDFKCTCHTGFLGKACEQRNDPCDPLPCFAGKCYPRTPTIPYCYCQPGYSGKFCEYNINDCRTDPCGNHGICLDGVDYYSCHCFRRYRGTDCSTDTCPGAPAEMTDCSTVSQDCQPDPCNSNGVCLPGPSCICRLGFTGRFCENSDIYHMSHADSVAQDHSTVSASAQSEPRSTLSTDKSKPYPTE